MGATVDSISNRRFRQGLVGVGATCMALLLAGCGTGGNAEDVATGEAQVMDQAGWDDIVEAANDEGQVVVYASLTGSESAFKEFEKENPEIDVTIERAPTTDLIARVDQEIEVDAQGADVVFHAQPSWFEQHSEAGDLAAVSLSPDAASNGWEDVLDGHEFAPVYAFPYLLGYNSKAVEAVTSIDELVDSAGDNSIGLLDPGTSTAAAFQYDLWNVHFGGDLLKRLSELNVTVDPSVATLSQKLAAGEYDYVVGLTPGVVEPLKEGGASVEEIVPQDAQSGPQYNVTTLANAAHPNAAQVFTNWLLSEDGQQMMIDHFAPGSVVLDVEGSIPWGQIATYDEETWDKARWDDWMNSQWKPKFG